MHDVVSIPGPSAAQPQRNRNPRLPFTQRDGPGAALRVDAPPKHVHGEMPCMAPASGGSSPTMAAHDIPLVAAKSFLNP